MRGIGTERPGPQSHGADKEKRHDRREIGLQAGYQARVKASSGREFKTGLVPKKTRERAKSGVNSHTRAFFEIRRGSRHDWLEQKHDLANGTGRSVSKARAAWQQKRGLAA